MPTAGPNITKPAMRPVAFDGLFGFLHQPQGGRFNTGVVLVSPLGRDERCARAPMRLFADQLAAAGFPVLRYDHRGEGDSLGLSRPDDDATPVWLDGVRAAADQLRARAGVTRVVLGGVRIGGALAALAGEDADGLMLLAPVLNGRSWIRRMRFSVGAAAQEAGPDSGAVDYSGLRLSAATVAGLSRADLPKMGLPPAKPVFLAAQNRLVETYGETLEAAGAPVSLSPFPGFEALFIDAHSNEPPQAVFTTARAWLEQTFAGAPLEPSAGETAPEAAELRADGVVERAVTFGEGLQGVVCEPEPPVRNGLAVLFCNTGGDPRAGIGGFATLAARALAAHGAASLRFDFQGLGDSPMTGEAWRSHVFETPREADLDAAVGLAAGLGYDRIAIVGVCAGAYHAVRLAERDPRVGEAFAVSPVKLLWREGDSLVFGRKDDGKATESYLKALRDPKTWTRLLAGGIDAATIARTLAGRIGGRLQGLRDRLAGRSPLPLLRSLSRRGGRARLMMGVDDISLDEVETWFGPRGARLTRLPGMTVEVDPRLDHGLARLQSREIVLQALLDWLGLA